ncbi:hypothetical protein N7492_004544 [Penicillium capsulatum]|uniref:Uncharacterized protein n=1 Tax=Penicillium capsulatum TaxID=69766 RepID=A0A9W9I832_9EURO|nr:hypothetical protein N7492_004544 [Penicillium capsulatum]KAJ6136339.1 hypothetical protein N7512_001499 [Penicillium capsulatum]
MQASRAITRSLPPSLNLQRRKRLSKALVTSNPPKPAMHNPPIDSDQLAYRLCELSLQKMQKEARASEPDIRHVLACNSMQRLTQQDILHRLDALQSTLNIQAIPLLPGADELMVLDNETMDMKSLEIAVNELEMACRRGEMAREICFQQIGDM